MPGTRMQATAQLEKADRAGVSTAIIRLTGGDEWYDRIRYKDRQGEH